MDGNNSLVDLSGLGQVGCLFIEKVANACGYLYCNSSKVIAKSAFIEEIKKSNLPINEKCILVNNANKIIKEYSNQNNIIKIALNHLNESSRPDEVDDSWISHLMDKARLVSNEQTQIIWGKILAEECNNPNTVPKSLLFSLEQMDKDDAKIFIEVCSCSVHLSCESDVDVYPIIHNSTENHYWKTHLKYDDFLRLEALGLIKQNFGMFEPGFVTDFINGPVTASYSEETFTFPDGFTHIPVDRVIFSRSGSVLCKIIDAPTIDGFFETQCVPYWKGIIQNSTNNS